MKGFVLSFKFTLSKVLGFYRPVPPRCIMVVAVSFLIALMAGYTLAPKVESDDWGLGFRFVNFRDKAFAPREVPLAERHSKFVKYIAHNTTVIALALCLGPFLFFWPLIRAVSVGGVIGVALWHLGSPWLWGRFFLPHSLVELPLSLYVDAVIMHGGLRWLTGGPEGRWNILKQEWLANLKLFLLLIPLIIFSALLEAYVTQ